MIGLGREEFWDLTLRQFFRELVIARRREESEHNRDMSLAWHTAAMVRCKKLPELRQLLIRPRFIKQSRVEQEAIFHSLAAKVKGRPRRVRLIHVKHDG